jgi:hypothetical protein
MLSNKLPEHIRHIVEPIHRGIMKLLHWTASRALENRVSLGAELKQTRQNVMSFKNIASTVCKQNRIIREYVVNLHLVQPKRSLEVMR